MLRGSATASPVDVVVEPIEVAVARLEGRHKREALPTFWTRRNALLAMIFAACLLLLVTGAAHASVEDDTLHQVSRRRETLRVVDESNGKGGAESWRSVD